MSFILDALRKSENARQRHGGPALAEVPIARRRENKQWWIAAVVALLLVNVVVLAIVLLRDNDEPAPAAAAVPSVAAPVAPATIPSAAVANPAPAPAAAPVQAAPAPNPVAANAPPATSRHSLAEEAAGAVDLQSSDADAPANAAIASNVPDRAPIVQALNPNAAAATAQGPNENLPTINELTGDRAVNMPAMHLDIHVYSDKPAERFVFINMRKYVEGATLTEGPVVERIRTDGVVLNQRGFRFVLPRQ